MNLENRLALVTGAGSGIGRATAMRFAEAGADVALLSRTLEELETLAAEIEGMGRRALVLLADVSHDDQMRAAFDRVEQEFGRLDILFANAGINGTWAPIDELTVEEWDKTNAVNLRGTFLSLHLAVPLMKAHGGSIVITSSINGTQTFTTAGATAYSATKAGQLAMGRMAAVELGPHNIRVNVVCPGAIDTEIADNTSRRDTGRAGIPAQFPEGDIPLTGGKPGSAAQVAELVLFLASDAASHISGTPIWIDGAQSLLI